MGPATAPIYPLWPVNSIFMRTPLRHRKRDNSDLPDADHLKRGIEPGGFVDHIGLEAVNQESQLFAPKELAGPQHLRSGNRGNSLFAWTYGITERRPLSRNSSAAALMDRKRHARALRNVEQRVLPVGKIKHPKPRIDLGSDRLAAGGAVKVAPSQLRLAIRIQVAISADCFRARPQLQRIHAATQPVATVG